MTFIPQAMGEMVLCKVAKDAYSKEAWKILESKFSARGSDMQQQDVSHSVESTAILRVDKQDSERISELEESQSKVDDGCEDYKSETHEADMHMDEEGEANIAERETQSTMCEGEQEHINAQGLCCKVVGVVVNLIVTKLM